MMDNPSECILKSWSIPSLNLHHLPKRSSFSNLRIPSNSHVFSFPPLQTQILQSSHRTKQLRWTTSCARATTSRWPATACMALPPSWSSPSKAVHSRDRGDRAITGITWNLMRDSSQDIFRGYDSRKMLILIDFVQMYHMSYGHMRQDWGPVKTAVSSGDCWQLAMALLGGNPDLFSYRKWKPWIAMKSDHLYPAF